MKQTEEEMRKKPLFVLEYFAATISGEQYRLELVRRMNNGEETAKEGSDNQT